MPNTITALPGQETVVACWDALARVSPGASVTRSGAVAAAVFPSWAPLNNAIVLNGDRGVAAAAVPRLGSVYAGAGVGAWALWMPARTTDLDAPDRVPDVRGLKRDTTTLVMHTTLSERFRLHEEVVHTSLATVKRYADDELVRGTELGEPEGTPGLSGWAIVRDGVAVTAAWSFRHEDDCGIYAVGTLPEWRRRGLARTLVEHMLADAGRRGSRSATLQSTRMGQPLYESLGFVPAGRYEEWVPR
jgi:GNAT superfamily N-acetyltransferase